MSCLNLTELEYQTLIEVRNRESSSLILHPFSMSILPKISIKTPNITEVVVVAEFIAVMEDVVDMVVMEIVVIGILITTTMTKEDVLHEIFGHTVKVQKTKVWTNKTMTRSSQEWTIRKYVVLHVKVSLVIRIFQEGM